MHGASYEISKCGKDNDMTMTDNKFEAVRNQTNFLHRPIQVTVQTVYLQLPEFAATSHVLLHKHAKTLQLHHLPFSMSVFSKNIL